MRSIPDSALGLIKGFEGFRSEPYLCAGDVPTIGYGTTVYPDGRMVTLDDPATAEGPALEWLRHDMASAAVTVATLVTTDMTDGQYGALVSLVYNIGPTAFRRDSVLRALNAGDKHEAAAEFRTHRLAGGEIQLGLVRRRAAEVVLYWS